MMLKKNGTGFDGNKNIVEQRNEFLTLLFKNVSK